MKVTVEKSYVFKNRWWLARDSCAAICWDGKPFGRPFYHHEEDVAYFASAADARRFARCHGLWVVERSAAAEATAEPVLGRPGVFLTRPPFKVGDRVRIVEGPCLGEPLLYWMLDHELAHVVQSPRALRVGDQVRVTVQGVDYPAKIVRYDGQRWLVRLLPNNWFGEIERWYGAHELAHAPQALRVGDRVRITSAVWTGCYGRVDRLLGNRGAWVAVDDAGSLPFMFLRSELELADA